MEAFLPEKMLFACDLADENINAYQRAKYISNLLNVSLHILYINTPGDNFLSSQDIDDKIAKFSNAVGAEFIDVKVYNDYTVEKGILNYSEDINAW